MNPPSANPARVPRRAIHPVTLIAALLAAVLLALLPACSFGRSAHCGRDLALFAALFFLPCLWLLKPLGAVLSARYDSTVLRPEPATELVRQTGATLDAGQQALWRQLQAWCDEGTGTGRRPLLQPTAPAAIPLRFSVAVLSGSDGIGKAGLVDAFARQLDRNDELAALAAQSRWQGLRLKLAVKWHELWWWRKRHPRQPWDCGYLKEDAASLARLEDFSPRRPTLIIADGVDEQALAQATATLDRLSAHSQQPLRLLVLAPTLPARLAASETTRLISSTNQD